MTALVEANPNDGADPVNLGFFSARRVMAAECVPRGVEEGDEGVSTEGAEMLREKASMFREPLCGAARAESCRSDAWWTRLRRRLALRGSIAVPRGPQWNVHAA